MKVVILGDSVTWGQGLLDQQKFHWLALQEIVANLGIDANDISIDQRAHSGAVVAKDVATPPLNTSVNLWQEVPHSTPTIWQQIPKATDAKVRLVILDGGINDVNFVNIVNPAVTKAELDKNIKRTCYQEMRELLTEIRRKYPNALIIVTGYYPLLSDATPITTLTLLVMLLSANVLSLFSTAPSPIPIAAAVATLATTKRVTNNVSYFTSRQLYWLRRAVLEKHSDVDTRGPGILFVHPVFGAKNAFGAPQQFLFSPEIRGNIVDIWERFKDDPLNILTYVDPTDSIVRQRELACKQLGNNFSPIDRVKCVLAGVGHPNQAGAQRYAKVIARNYQEYTRISLKSSLKSLQKTNEPLKLRQVMQRFDFLKHQFRFKNLHQFLYIDCISVRIKTRDEAFAGTDQAVKLRVGKDREWILNESIFAGDDVDEFERGETNEYTIDPANGNPNNRFHLSELKEVTLILEPDISITDIELGAWKPESIELSINGHSIFYSRINTTLYAVEIAGLPNSWTAARFP